MSTCANGSPHLSVVATSRNDNHGGDLDKRTQLFIDGLAAQAKRHRLLLELILVEWNPPADRPPLAKALRWPLRNEFFDARIVTVPHKYHVRLDPKGALPLFQMIAKNVGIRRARGRFVLATNIDVLFPDALFRTMADGLREGVLYRNDRFDVSREMPAEGAVDELLEYCRSHVIRKHLASGTYMPVNGEWRNTSPTTLGVCWSHVKDWNSRALAQARVHVQEFRRRLSSSAFGRRLVNISAMRTVLANRHVRFAVGCIVAPPAIAAYVLLRPRQVGSALALRGYLLRRAYRVYRSFIRLHTNGCGDFTLLDRESWFRLRGYPEWPIFSWTLDSIFLFQAEANRLKNHQLSASQCTYHVDHGAGWTPEEHGKLFARLEEKGVRWLSDADVYRLWEEMQQARRRRVPVVYNPESWGFADVDLPEVRP